MFGQCGASRTQGAVLGEKSPAPGPRRLHPRRSSLALVAAYGAGMGQQILGGKRDGCNPV